MFLFGRTSTAKANSKIEKRLAECLPAADWPVYDENGDLKAFNGWHVFGSETARLHFIKHVLILLSNNGKHDLSNLYFDNFFARSYDKAGVIWYTASIVVTKPGDFRILHSIVASRAGTSKTSAFQLLMLDVETKLDAVLRGHGANNVGLPVKASTAKVPVSAVSIISTPSEAMAPPNTMAPHKTKHIDYNTWSGAPLAAFPKSKIGTQTSHASQGSQSTQSSQASSNDSQVTQSSQSTAPTTHSGSVTLKPSYEWLHSSSAGIAETIKQCQHARHASLPVKPPLAPVTPTPKAAKHTSQPLHPRSASTPPTTIKALPALPKTASMEQLSIPPEPKQIHPALRSKSNSTEGLNASAESQKASIVGSSVYSRSPISPIDTTEKEVQALRVDPEMPSPLHFEKPISKTPARLLRRQTEFEIYV